MNNYCSKGEILAEMQQGDTFPILMVNKLDGTIINVEEDYDLTVALYRSDGKLITKGSLSDERILVDDGLYILEITHVESMMMVGDVRVELTLCKEDKTTVYHGDKTPYVHFDPTNNNTII